MKIIDLTHPFNTKMPIWPGDPEIQITKVATTDKDGYLLNRIELGEHSGTHIGAPSHMVSGKKSIDQIPPEQLVTPAIKIEVLNQCINNPDYLISHQDITNWESRNQPISKNCVVLFETGWSRYWKEHDNYLGTDRNNMHFPGISVQAAQYLLTKNIAGIGIDTAGLDGGQSNTFTSNQLAAQNNIYHLENLTNLQNVPAIGATLFVGALPFLNGSGSPCRVLAVIND